ADLSYVGPQSEREGERVAGIKRADIAETQHSLAVQPDRAAAECGIAAERPPAPATSRISQVGVQFVVRGETSERRDVGAAGERLCPLLLQWRDVLIRERAGQVLNRLGQPLLLGLLFAGRQRERRRGVARAPIKAFLRHAVEEGVKLIELLLRDRVVFM